MAGISFNRDGDPIGKMRIGRAASAYKILSVEEEWYNGGRINSEADVPEDENTWGRTIDDDDYVDYVLSNWKKVADRYFSVWYLDPGEDDINDAMWTPICELEGSYVEYKDKFYYIPVSGKAKTIADVLKESMDFERNKDPHQAIGIGKKFRIEQWLKEMEVKNWTINEDFTIDVEGHTDLGECGLIEFPPYIKFGKISGYFTCHNNRLISLKGGPKYVAGDFCCSINNLSSPEGCPSYVGGDFYCEGNIEIFDDDIEKLCKVEGYIYNIK